MKNVVLFFVLAGILLLFHSYGQEQASADEHLAFKSLIEAGKWDELASLFPEGKADKGYRTLKDYFVPCKSITFAAPAEKNRLTYKAKFKRRGEVGVITFEKQAGKYTRLEIGNQIRPLYFIESYQKYRVSGETPVLNLGDAVIRFKEGTFYQPLPFKFLLLFDGDWEFSITPGDREERMTLKRKFKSESLTLSPKQGIFIIENRDFTASLSPVGEVSPLSPVSPVYGLLRLYNERYGIKIPRFDEYWYLPFPDSAELVMFRKDKQSLYIYSFQPDAVPDTQLVASGDNTILLGYNAHKGLKLTFDSPASTGAGDVDLVKLNIFYNPGDNFISGVFNISYRKASTLHMLYLAEGLKLQGNLDTGSGSLNVFRKKDQYYVLGSETDKLSLYYKGNIQAASDSLELFRTKGERLDRRGSDDFYFLSKNRNFYPNPGEFYFQTDVTLSLPRGMNGLISGNLVEKSDKGRNVIRSTGRRSKGISLVCGDFTLSRRLDSKIPIDIYCSPSFDYSNFLDLREVRSAADFFFDKFGSPQLPVLNILLERGVYEGGISNTGFMIIDINPNRNLKNGGLYLISSDPHPRINSPVLIRDAVEDHVFHELAHQWWGGKISWKTYNDVWITEGLAHFSVLYYLKHHLPMKTFKRIIKKLKRWILRYNHAGPISYGTRIHQLEDSYEAYQSVIYNKGAFLYLMLLDILGEEDFQRRLRSVLEKYAWQSISLAQFTRRFSGENKMLAKFFRGWVFSREIPRIRFDARVSAGNTGQCKIRVTQLNGDFVFPLKVRVVTTGETLYKTVVVEEKTQSFAIAVPGPVKSIKPVDDITPLRIEK